MNFIIKKKGSETMSFQENLRYYREKAGYKQAKDFAEALNIPYSTYTGYEVRNREPKYETLCRIADLLQVSTDDLLGRTTNILGNKDDNELKTILNASICTVKEYEKNFKVHSIEKDFIIFSNKLSYINIMFKYPKNELIDKINFIELDKLNNIFNEIYNSYTKAFRIKMNALIKEALLENKTDINKYQPNKNDLAVQVPELNTCVWINKIKLSKLIKLDDKYDELDSYCKF